MICGKAEVFDLIADFACRREDWGWELRSQIYALRSVEHGSSDGLWDDVRSQIYGLRSVEHGSSGGLWDNITAFLVIEKRRKGVPCTRAGSGIKYKRREVPDIKELKEFLARVVIFITDTCSSMHDI